jgi:hypothetical protein
MQMRDDRASDPEAPQATARAGMDIEDSYEVEFEDDGDEENDDGDDEEGESEEGEALDDDYDEFLFADEEDD